MNAQPFFIPDPIVQTLGRLPAYPGTMMLVTVLNLVLARHLSTEVTNQLHGKKLRLRVTDAHWAFDFEWRSHWFVASHHSGGADLTISACMNDFLLLARRQEDPDTLFFSRRLSMEGDTELGLLVKNTLDAIELPFFHAAQFHSKAVLTQLRDCLCAGLSGCKR